MYFLGSQNRQSLNVPLTSLVHDAFPLLKFLGGNQERTAGSTKGPNFKKGQIGACQLQLKMVFEPLNNLSRPSSQIRADDL